MAVAIVKTAANIVSVPVVLHLDHGVTYEQNIASLKAGFTSLMYDGSELPLDENIKVTAAIVKEAHPRGIPVEAELGKIPKIEEFFDMLPADYDYSYPPPQAIQEKVIELMAKPEDVERFVEQTGCDSLAAAIGSIHGMKNDVQQLYIERLREIRKRTNIPIVCHGSSGVIQTRKDVEALEAKGWKLPEGWGCMEDAIKEGLAKINIATAVSMSFLRGMKAAWDKNPDEKDSRKITGPGRDAMKETIKGYMRLFGSSGQIVVAPKAKKSKEGLEGPE
jgi:fructose-bisphosphate aldolase class II